MAPEQLTAQGFEVAAVTLYRLIRSRAFASQMVSSRIKQVTAEFESAQKDLKLRTTASHTTFPGFTAAYAWTQTQTSSNRMDDEEVDEQGDNQNVDESTSDATHGLSLRREIAAALSSLQSGTAVGVQDPAPLAHQTKGPPRFSEGSLVKALEEVGVGRPSTYAPTMKLLQARKYVRKEGRALHAEPLGRVLSAFLSLYFPTYVDYDFTSRMEGALDEVSGGEAEWTRVLGEFWGPFSGAVASKAGLTGTEIIDALNEELKVFLFGSIRGGGSGGAAEEGKEPDDIEKSACGNCAEENERSFSCGDTCPSCNRPLSLKLSHKGGPFVGCTAYPDCTYSRPIRIDEASISSGLATTSEGHEGMKLAEKYGMRGPVRLLGAYPDSKYCP